MYRNAAVQRGLCNLASANQFTGVTQGATRASRRTLDGSASSTPKDDLGRAAQPPQNCCLRSSTLQCFTYAGYVFVDAVRGRSLCKEYQRENTFQLSDLITSQTVGWLLAWRALSRTLHKPQASLLHWAVPVARIEANRPPIPSKLRHLSHCPFFPLKCKKLAKLGAGNI
jgi:hypothetical protein